MRIAITGGHHTSALPVISELKNRDQDAEIFWFGHKFSLAKNKNPTLEYKDITGLDIPFYNLHAGKLYKTFNPVRLAKVPFGFFQSLYLLLKTKPDLILSFGGYLAAPVVLAGKLLGIPSITHEQTVVAGYANKFIAKYVDKILISWEESAMFFPAEKVVYTGLPLRESIFTQRTNNFNLAALPTVYVTAGKTGSHFINTNVLNSLEKLLSKYNLIIQTGDHSGFSDYEDIKSKAGGLSNLPGKCFVRKYISNEEIGEVYAKSDVVVCRTGAHTTMELLALNKKAVLIPIPWVSHNEQYENARIVADRNLGEILEQKDLSAERLIESINKVYEMPANKDIFEYENNAAKLIVDEVFKITR